MNARQFADCVTSLAFDIGGVGYRAATRSNLVVMKAVLNAIIAQIDEELARRSQPPKLTVVR